MTKEKRLTRDKALELVKEYNKEPGNLAHYLESEAIMKELAMALGEDSELWGLLGLLHDIDWEMTKSKPEEHLTKAPELLRKAGFDESFINVIVSHGYGFNCAGLQDRKRTLKVEHALACAETVTGLIHAYALMRGTMQEMEPKGLLKKYKDKKFAANVSREIIKECEELGLSLEEFFRISIMAVQKIAGEVGLESERR